MVHDPLKGFDVKHIGHTAKVPSIPIGGGGKIGGKSFSNYAKFAEAVTKHQDQYVKRIAELIMARASENATSMDIVDRGGLLGAFYIEKIGDAHYRVGNKAGTTDLKQGFLPYPFYIEFGAGPAVGHAPFLPPYESIEAWVKRNIRATEEGTVVKPESKKGTRAVKKKDLGRLVNAIRFKIKERGFFPRPFFRDAIAYGESRRKEIYNQEYVALLRGFTKK